MLQLTRVSLFSAFGRGVRGEREEPTLPPEQVVELPFGRGFPRAAPRLEPARPLSLEPLQLPARHGVLLLRSAGRGAGLSGARQRVPEVSSEPVEEECRHDELGADNRPTRLRDPSAQRHPACENDLVSALRRGERLPQFAARSLLRPDAQG